ncbi:HD-GYP domain-containing protein [Sedimenticola selenatireducens]|uniref:HD-GYP domain-containing protein n=1 Tax=Sedimenticola selenatireducens TaxID=191960 RepID=UPI0026EEACD0|nr:two-component system response regulator [Sedimenticola selenatireducens]
MSQNIEYFGDCEDVKRIILIVDDDPGNLEVLGSLLHAHYQVLAARSGQRALLIASSEPKPDLILLDVLMPEMDGHAVIRRLKEKPETKDIPIIFVTALGSIKDEEMGLELGAVDYITKPYRPPIVLARVHTQLELKLARDLLKNQNMSLEAEVKRRMKDILLTQDVTINALAELAETRDPETGYHIRRTQEYIRVLAKYLQKNPKFSDFLTDTNIDLLVKSAPLHDIGKVGIPDHILLKPGKLTDEEWVIMKTHTRLGGEAIQRALQRADRSIDFLNIAQEIALGHHEKWDGSGYPDGKKGDEIPIPARLMALADVFDALISRRVYKSPMPAKKARAIIIDDRGKHFDPDIVDAFTVSFESFIAIADKYKEVG